LAVIKQAYKDLVNVWHPDRFEHNAGLRHRAEGRFKDIQEAYNHVMTHFKQTSQ
jgi:DnaJ-class molecular chaperone